jgi:MoaA/NifB/PqqE/SkfB family radical SAM enzyme
VSSTAEAIERGWWYAIERNPAEVPPERRIEAADGRLLTRRLHGYTARVHATGDASRATLLLAASATGRVLESLGMREPLRVEIGTRDELTNHALILDKTKLIAEPSLSATERRIANLWKTDTLVCPPASTKEKDRQEGLSSTNLRSARRVLFFESLMNTDMPHNDQELSGGVLHMASALRAKTGAEVVLANVKIGITGSDRTPLGLDDLPRVLAGGPVDLVCITLLEGYFEGVVALIDALRKLGCDAHVAVGGVMPTLAPEHVAAHLPGVSFVCRGAGEYFVPRLAQIVGTSRYGERFTPAQIDALLASDGIIAVSERDVIGGNPGRIVRVDDLDHVDLDLTLLDAHHVRSGIEISTSRGCIHRCTFCTIMGRESYQSRTASNVLDMLSRYHGRFTALFGDDIPHTAFRVHVSDDDFACDRDRAAAIFRAIRQTPFRFSSVQISIADLCKREEGRLLPVADRELLEAITPDCFADNGRAIPLRDFVADHRSRNWSAFIQLGIETFSDAELVRLGKGYRLAHIRAIADEFAKRKLHWDAYFIVSNADTSAEELVDSVMEVCRFKLRWPQWFHLRFPVVPRLVSYWPSASYKRLLRDGDADVCSTRFVAATPEFVDLDYPFVRHDEPHDEWVAAALPPDDAIETPTFLTDGGFYTTSLDRLRDIWMQKLSDSGGEAAVDSGGKAAALGAGNKAAAPQSKARIERLIRRLDDAPRRLAFANLERAQQHDRANLQDAMSVATELLGPLMQWKRAYQRFASEEAPRLVVIPTWQCELRCTYCFIPKQDGRVMTIDTMERAIDLLLSSERPEVILQFFGGEAMMEWGLVQHALTYGSSRAKEIGKKLRFIISSNGWTLDEERIAWLQQFPVKLELSLDGDEATQNRFRPAHEGDNSYTNGIAPRAKAILASGLTHDVIMVVHPIHVSRMAENFFHIASLGFERIQINFALGFPWTPPQRLRFAAELDAIGRELRTRWERGEKLMLINLEQEPPRVRLNAEITVDFDGTVYGGNAFLHETQHKEHFRLGTLDDLRNFDRYWLDAPTNDAMLDWSYRAEVTKNNLKVGAIMRSYIRWMRNDGIASPAAPA